MIFEPSLLLVSMCVVCTVCEVHLGICMCVVCMCLYGMYDMVWNGAYISVLRVYVCACGGLKLARTVFLGYLHFAY